MTFPSATQKAAHQPLDDYTSNIQLPLSRETGETIPRPTTQSPSTLASENRDVRAWAHFVAGG